MGYEVLVILFIVLSVVSSIINKLQENKKQRELESQGTSQRGSSRRPVDEEEDEEPIDLSDLFPGLELPGKPGEFREIRGKRPVSEESTGDEFQEISGKRPVSEEGTGPEFREVQGKRPVSEETSGPEFREVRTPTESARSPLEKAVTPSFAALSSLDLGTIPDAYRKKRRRRILLDFNRESVRKGILYSEILGPPRGERMFE